MTTNRKQIEETLWASAEQLRANSSLKLNEMFEPILGLIFLKFADVKFQQTTKKIDAERSQITGRKPPITPELYRKNGVPFIPAGAYYSHLMNLPEDENLGQLINEAMKSIEELNPDLAGTLPREYTKLAKQQSDNNKILLTLLRSFNQIPDDIQGDSFGEIYEFFLGEFAMGEGSKGGEFFTPQSIVNLMVHILEPYKGKILDPACGTGGMFVHSAKFVSQHSNNLDINKTVSIYGQEKSASNIRIAKMNLAIHGLSGNIVESNSFYEDNHSSIGKFDFVLANPPFNVKGKDKKGQIVIDPAMISTDKRYSYGIPLTGKGDVSNANYLWIQMFANALNATGRAGFVMANVASDAGNAEENIRRKLIDDQIVDVVISVGPNMFLNATLSCTLWFFDKGKVATERADKVLFINAQDIFTVVDRAHNKWTDSQIDEISSIVKSFRGEKGATPYKDIIGRCKVVLRSTLSENDYSLNPGRYIDIQVASISDEDFNLKKADFLKEYQSLLKESQTLSKAIEKKMKI
ncbi:HsdM Type I restriction-modification system methyltransferase subunit [Candidatus Nanopelagicaceae bacterium]